MTDARAPHPPRPQPLEPGDDLTAMDFGQSLRRLRRWAGLSVVTLPAKVADLSRTSLSEYERATRMPGLEIVDAAVTACLAQRGFSVIAIAAELQYWRKAWVGLQRPQQTRTAAPTEQAAHPERIGAAASGAPTQGQPQDNPRQAGIVEGSTPHPATAADGGVEPKANGTGSRWVRGGAAAAVVFVAAAVVVTAAVVLGTGAGGGSATPAPISGNPGDSDSGRPVVPGRTYTQTVNTPPGARTYTDPYNLIGEGPRIDNGRNVQVSCTITAPSAPSVGLYWYLIASPPWGNQYYSPANAFLNGDPPQGPGTSVVDETVPDCPR